MSYQRNLFITGFLSTSFWILYFISYPEAIVHENAHCLGCKLLYSDSKCIYDYNFFNLEESSSLTCIYNDSNNTCISKNIDDKYIKFIISFLPYLSFNIYNFFCLIILFFNLYYNFNIYLYIFFYIFITLSYNLSIFFYFLKDNIEDFKNIEKKISKVEFLNLYSIIVGINGIQVLICAILILKNNFNLFIIYKIKNLVGKNNLLKNLLKIFNSKSFDTLEIENKDVILLLVDNHYNDDYKKLYLIFIKHFIFYSNIISNFLISYFFMILILFKDCFQIKNYIILIYFIHFIIKLYNYWYQSIYIKTKINNFFLILEILPLIFINIYTGIYYFYLVNISKLLFYLYYI
jgi:hypothetical protein